MFIREIFESSTMLNTIFVWNEFLPEILDKYMAFLKVSFLCSFYNPLLILDTAVWLNVRNDKFN